MSLAEFLLARIEADAQEARDAGADAMVGFRWKHYPEDAYNEVQALTLAHSRRVLAECAAKRTIVEAFVDMEPVESERREQVVTLRWACQVLASVYRDHEDFDESWAQ